MPRPDPNHPHHQDAAKHLELAAKCHRRAARQHDAGKDKSAARHALLAHAHTLQALAQSEDAIRQYAGHQAAGKGS